MKKSHLGDILLVNYLLDPVGWLISLFTGNIYNHVAIFIDKETIFEVRGTKNRITKLSEYNKFYYKTKVLRLKRISKKGIKKVIAELKVLKDVKRKRIDIWKAFYDVIRKRKPEKNTCSGTIALFLEIYSNFKFDLKKEPKMITPGDIDKSEEIKEIK